MSFGFQVRSTAEREEVNDSRTFQGKRRKGEILISKQESKIMKVGKYVFWAAQRAIRSMKS